jgi:hypothetical protein
MSYLKIYLTKENPRCTGITNILNRTTVAGRPADIAATAVSAASVSAVGTAGTVAA